MQNARISYTSRHPIILHGQYPIAKLIISSEHSRLLHAGPTLVMASFCHRRKAVQSITRKCITCYWTMAKPQNQLLGQLPSERVVLGSVFDNVGVNYAGPFYLKYGSVCKPMIIKAYVCIFVSQSGSFGIRLKSDHRCVHCYTPALHRLLRQAVPYMEWPQDKLYWRCPPNETVLRIPWASEDTRSYFPILHDTGSFLEVYP